MNARVSLIALRHTVRQPTLIKISAIGTSCGIFGIGCMICILLASFVNNIIWLGKISQLSYLKNIATLGVLVLSVCFCAWKVSRDLRINNQNTEERKLKLKELLEEHGDRLTNRGIRIEWGMESLVLIYYLLEKLRNLLNL